MRKIILSIIMIVASVFYAKAQVESKNAIGLRIGGNSGLGTEVSYQRGISENNRIELDLGWQNSKDYNAIRLTGVYQWVWDIDQGFNWYAGAGGGIATASNKNTNESQTSIYSSGDLGIEYIFDKTPILLSMDIRPELSFENGLNLGTNIALGVRYLF